MPDWSAFSFLFVPAVTFGAIGLLVLVLRWAFSGSPSGSLVARQPRPGPPEAYGLLVPVAAPVTEFEGELLRRSLEEHGLPASLAMTSDGPRVLVWPADERRARAVLRGQARS